MEGWNHIDMLLQQRGWVEGLTEIDGPDESLLEKLSNKKRDARRYSKTDEYARFARQIRQGDPNAAAQLERLKLEMKKAPLSRVKKYTSKVVRFSRYEEIDDFLRNSLHVRIETRVYSFELNADYTIYQLRVDAADVSFFVEAKAKNPNVAMQNCYEQLLKRIWTTLEKTSN